MRYVPIVIHQSIFGFTHDVWRGKPRKSKMIAVFVAKIMAYWDDHFVTPNTGGWEEVGILWAIKEEI